MWCSYTIQSVTVWSSSIGNFAYYDLLVVCAFYVCVFYGMYYDWSRISFRLNISFPPNDIRFHLHQVSSSVQVIPPLTSQTCPVTEEWHMHTRTRAHTHLAHAHLRSNVKTLYHQHYFQYSAYANDLFWWLCISFSEDLFLLSCAVKAWLWASTLTTWPGVQLLGKQFALHQVLKDLFCI